MKFVVDMNLTPSWAECLNGAGHAALHWSDIGAPDAGDDEVVRWAAKYDRIILTSDLDFGTMLALSGADRPSVVQLRTESTMPERIGGIVLAAIARAETELLAGALMTIDTAQPRLRILPIKQGQ